MILNGEVFYERRVTLDSTSPIEIDASTIDAQFALSFTDPNIPSPSTRELFVRSEYAQAYDIEIEKRFLNVSSPDLLRTGDRIRVEVALKNTSSGTIDSLEYLDTIPSIFTLLDGGTYRTDIG
jgi:hypothetical protein